MDPGQESADIRRARVIRLIAALAIVLIAAVVLVVAAGGGDDDSGGGGTAGTAEEATGVELSREMLEGVPQSGTSLGDPDAPVVVTEFADLQCPFCAEYATNALPRVIQDHVRNGDVRLELRLLRFIGPDSERGARAAHHAATEDRMWDFVDLWYRNQGPEGTGYADDDYIRSLAEGAGIDADGAVQAANGTGFKRELEQAEADMEAAGLDSTPSFTVSVDGGPPEVLPLADLTGEAFAEAIAPYLRK